MAKKLLLIMPDFYTYSSCLKTSFEKEGFDVSLFFDRPSNNFIQKTLLRINKGLCRREIKNYQNKIINHCIESGGFDVIFVIDGQCFFQDFFAKLSIANRNAKKIYYLWDSISTFPFMKYNIKYFDFVYTFDRKDSITYNIRFLPLFFTDEYKNLGSNVPTQINLDYSVITTAKPGKLEFIDKAEKLLESKHFINKFEFIYVQSKLVLFYYKLKYKEFRKFRNSRFSFKRMQYEEAAKCISHSAFIIDCPQKGQTGLTMRTLECLAAHKKIITSNIDILNYPFYNSNDIYLLGYNKNDPLFFETSFVSVDDYMLNLYIDNWVNQIIGIS